MLARMAWPVVAVFALGNAVLFGVVRASRVTDVPVDVQTRNVYRARVDAFFDRAPGPRAAVLGDSLVFGGHLAKGAAPEFEHTLPAQLERVGRARGMGALRVLNLGIDGVLYGDLRCAVEDVLARAPDVLVLNVSPRPFSRDFIAGGNESERAFLCPSPVVTTVGAWQAVVEDAAYEWLPVVHYRDLLQFHLLGTTPHAGAVERGTAALAWLGERLGRAGVGGADGEADAGADEQDEDDARVLAEMMQRMRAAQRYDSIEVSDAHPQAKELAALLRLLARQTRTRVLVFYLRENLDPIAAQLDRAYYEETTRAFVARVERGLRGASRARFREIEAAAFAGQYVDHIHLTADGYARLAERLWPELPP